MNIQFTITLLSILFTIACGNTNTASAPPPTCTPSMDCGEWSALDDTKAFHGVFVTQSGSVYVTQNESIFEVKNESLILKGTSDNGFGLGNVTEHAGEIWVSSSQTIYRLGVDGLERMVTEGLENCLTNPTLLSIEDDLLIGCDYYSGFGRVNPAEPSGIEEHPFIQVNDLAQSVSGSVLIATYWGIYEFQPGASIANIDQEAFLEGERAVDVQIEDEHSAVWQAPTGEFFVGTSNSGVFVSANDELMTIQGAEQLRAYPITDIWGTHYNNVIAVGSNGAFHFDGTQWTLIQEGSFTSVHGDELGRIWLTGRNRLSLFTPTQPSPQ